MKENNLNRIILCLGSNLNKEKNIECAANLLRTHFVSIRFSVPVETEPLKCKSTATFLNQVALIDTTLDLTEVHRILKSIESQLGRTPEDKINGLIPIDIDLLQFNNQILKPEDLSRDYVINGIRSLRSSC